MTRIHDQVLPKGTQIGVHEIKDVLRMNSFSITYRAWNHHLKGWVELHEYFPHEFATRGDNDLSVEPKSSSDKENFDYGLRVFLDQAEILTQIDHPNIANAENALQFNGTVYLILDYQEGVPLAELEHSSISFGETELKFILISILNALEKMHENKIVHGGIQPRTILLGKDGEPVLTDFSAARLAFATRCGKLGSELAAGYAPAEQYEQANVPGLTTDFYALGATMYHCITHRQPVVARDRVIALSKGGPDPIGLLSNSKDTIFSADLLKIIDWMLCPAQIDRPQSVSEILEALKSVSASDESESTTSEATDTTESNPVAKLQLWIGVLVGLAVLSAGGLWFLLPDEKDSELSDSQPNIATVPSLPQQNNDQVTVESEKNEKEPIALAVIESDQESDLDKASEHHEIEVIPLTEIDTKKPPLTIAEKDSIERHLVAAEKAIEALHFTTPLGNNAYEHYQTILRIESGNTAALVGLERIVDWYVVLIEKARAEAQIKIAQVYLRRAEAVLPDSPKLHRIREKFTEE